MTPVSTRYIRPSVLLLTVALLPVWAHTLEWRRGDDCADPVALWKATAIEGTLGGGEGQPPPINENYRVQRTLGTARPGAPDLPELEFEILRAYDPKDLYLDARSPTRLALQVSSRPPKVRWIAVDGERLPIQLTQVEQSGRSEVVAYLYAWGARPVAHPFRAQLAAALPQLFTGTRPMTLLLVSGYASPVRAAALKDSAIEWLGKAWRHYRGACRA